MEPLIKAQYLNKKKQEYCSMNPTKKQKIKCISDAAKISKKKANDVQHKLDHYISVSERGHITYVQFVIEYYIEKQLCYLKKINTVYTVFSLR